MTTAKPDGSLVQTLEGAYPGSILFGPDVHMEAKVTHDYIPPQFNKQDEVTSKSNNFGYGGMGLFIFLAVGLTVALRRRIVRQRYDLPYRYEGVFQIESLQSGYDETDGGAENSVSYVELASSPARN